MKSTTSVLLRIRIRSLLAAIRVKEKNMKNAKSSRQITSALSLLEEMRKKITPSSVHRCHRSILNFSFRHSRAAGYNLVIPDVPSRECVDVGLKYVNNDACYPSLIVIGQIMSAVMSGKYDLSKNSNPDLTDRWWLSCNQLHWILSAVH